MPRRAACLAVIALAACTVGDGRPTTPAPAPPTERDPRAMSEETLDTYDPGRELERPAPGGTDVCGSWCDPCEDVTAPPGGPGCLNRFACASSNGPGGDALVVVIAIVVVSRRRRRRDVYARAREGDPVLEEHLNDVP